MHMKRRVLGPDGCLARLGKHEAFENVFKAQVHSIATAAIQRCLSAVHENVVGYDEAG